MIIIKISSKAVVLRLVVAFVIVAVATRTVAVVAERVIPSAADVVALARFDSPLVPAVLLALM